MQHFAPFFFTILKNCYSASEINMINKGFLPESLRALQCGTRPTDTNRRQVVLSLFAVCSIKMKTCSCCLLKQAWL